MDDIMQHVLNPLAMAIYMHDRLDLHREKDGKFIITPSTRLFFKSLLSWPSFNRKSIAGLFSEHFSPLRSHHSFTIRYSLDEDTGPLTSLPPKP